MKYFLNIKSIKSVDSQEVEEQKVWRIIASSERVDRAGDKILLSAWDLKNFLKNPIILFGHDSYSLENAIGKAVYVEITDKELIIDVVFSKTNPKGEMVEARLEEGMTLAASVGYIEKESKMEGDIKVITKAELVELSVVLIGCNPDAVVKMKAFAELKKIEMKVVEEIVEGEKTFTAKSVSEEVVNEVKENETVEEKTEKTVEEVTEEIVEEITEEKKEITTETEAITETETTTEAELEEENEIEIEEEVVDEDIEIELEDTEEKDFEIELEEEVDTETKGAIIEKEGRRLSNATIEKISQVKAIASDLQNACKSLIATLDNLIGEGEKDLDGYITINAKEINEMREKLRSSNRAESDVLSKLNNLLN